MTLPQALAFGILFAMMAMFAWGKLRYDLVAMPGCWPRVLAGIVPYDKAFSGFSDDIVIIVAGALAGERRGRALGRDRARDPADRPVSHPHAVQVVVLDRHGDGPVGVREEHRRAGDDDAGRVPARTPPRTGRSPRC